MRMSGEMGCATYGVARFETSLVIWTWSVFDNSGQKTRGTYNINSTVPSDGNDSIDRPKVDTDDCRQLLADLRKAAVDVC